MRNMNFENLIDKNNRKMELNGRQNDVFKGFFENILKVLIIIFGLK